MTCMSFQQSRVWVSLFWAMGPSHLQHFLQDGRVSVAIFWYPESRGKCKPKVLELTKAETEWNICQMPYILILSDSQILKLTLLICALTLRWILVLHDGSNGCIIKSGPVCDSCGAAAPFESKDGRDAQLIANDWYDLTHTQNVHNSRTRIFAFFWWTLPFCFLKFSLIRSVVSLRLFLLPVLLERMGPGWRWWGWRWCHVASSFTTFNVGAMMSQANWDPWTAPKSAFISSGLVLAVHVWCR